MVQAVTVVVSERLGTLASQWDKPVGYREWSHQDTRGPTTTETGGASSSMGDKHCQDFGGKKNTRVRDGKGLGANSSVSLRMISSKKSNLSKTHKTNTKSKR